MDLGGDERLLERLHDLGFGQTGAEPLGDRLANPHTGNILQTQPARHGGPRGHFHATGRVLREHAFPLEIAVGTRHRLWIREQLLGKGAILREASAGLQGPRGDMSPDLVGDLLVNRHW